MSTTRQRRKPPSTKNDYIYQILHEDIMSGALQPGQRLRLAEIAAQYSISEMPVREALRRLQADGLVKFEMHRGATVSAVPLSRVVEIIATRTFIEVLAITEAAPFHTEASLKEAEEVNMRLLEATDAKVAGELNRQFHVFLYSPCPNTFLKQEIDALWNKVWSTQQRSVFERRPIRMRRAVDEHSEILDAIRSGSVEEVQHAVMTHRKHTLDSWLAELEIGNAESAP